MFTMQVIRRNIEIKIKVIVKFVRRKLIGPKISEKMRQTKKRELNAVTKLNLPQ